MRSDQRKPVLMVPDLLGRCLPTLHRVALLASRTELPAMYVGVAIRATRAHILKHKISVALAAGHLGVHSAQRIACLVVIKFGDVPDRFPARGGVAVFAGYLDGSVRITIVFLVRLGISVPHRRKEQKKEDELYPFRREQETQPRLKIWVRD
jgi:hypothetical protein